MSSTALIVIGHTALDFVYRIDAFPPKPVKVRAREHVTSGGGMAANAACAASRLGANTALWSRIGSDPASRIILDELQKFGVDTTHVKVHPATRSATAAVIVDAAGERFIVSEDDHAMPMTADWLPLENICKANAVLSDLSWIEGTRAAFAEARARNITTLVDLDLGSGRLLESVAHLTDYVIASAPALDTFISGNTTEDRLRALVNQGARHAGVTRGSEGYVWTDASGKINRQPSFRIAVHDTTGAGDAFHGAFAAALIGGCSDAKCARFAAAAAALNCRGLGARTALPARADVDALLATQPAAI
jgi:sulfofructose kinase